MDDRQRAANNALDAAIREHVNAYRTADDGQVDDGMVVDFVVVVQTASFDGDGDEMSAYYMAYSNGSMPEHRAVGLLHWGIHMVKTGRPE